MLVLCFFVLFFFFFVIFYLQPKVRQASGSLAPKGVGSSAGPPPLPPSKPPGLGGSAPSSPSSPGKPPALPPKTMRTSTNAARDSPLARDSGVSDSDDEPALSVLPRAPRSFGRNSLAPTSKRMSVNMVDYSGEMSVEDEDEQSSNSSASKSSDLLRNGTRQRSNSWRDKIIRGSLDCDDEDIIIPAGEGNSDDDSEGDSQNDQLFAWGALLDKYNSSPMPLRIGATSKDDFNVRAMACGQSHMLLLTESGHVWSFGKGDVGQLGLGDTFMPRSSPKLVMFLTDQAVTAIAAAGNHSACLDELGRLSEWGQMHDSRPIVCKPTLKVEFLNTRIERVALGQHHSVASTSNGKVMTWGRNVTGALGIEYVTDFSETPCLVPIMDRAFEVAASSEGSACVTLKGVVYYWGTSWKHKEHDKVLRPTKLPFRDPISTIALGRFHILAVTLGNRSRLLTLGDNSYGQTGAPTLVPMASQTFGEPFAVRVQEAAASPAGAPASDFESAATASPVVTRGARSVSVAMDAPIDASGRGSAGSSGGGLRAAFRKMSSKQNMAKQAAAAAGERPSSFAGAPGAVPQTSAASLRMQERGQGRSFSLSGPQAPKIRSRAEREADLAMEMAASSPGGGGGGSGGSGIGAGVKAVRAGSKWSVMVTTDGQVWCMGEFQVGETEQDCVQFGSPTRVQELADVMIADVAGSDSCILASVGLRNEEDLKFQSFNPPTIRAASLPQLVNWICTEKTKPDALFVYTFILTYHCFTTAPNLLAKLRSRYEQALSEGSVHGQTQICNFLVRWLQQRGEDFLDRATRDGLDSFIKVIVQEPMVRVLQRLLIKLVPDMETNPEAPLSNSNAVAKLEPTDYAATAVADAMTLCEHILFSRIKLQEFIGQGWSKPDKAERCPGLCEVISSFNKWSVYVAASIINSNVKEVRTKRFAFWVEVHKQLFNLNNLALATAVGAAFELTPVYKLRTRNMIDVKTSAKKWLTYFGELQSNNKTGYRKLIRKIMAESDPGIPYVGGQLSDLTFLEDGNKSEVDGLINVRKFHMIAKQVRIIDQLQKRKYTGLAPPAELKQFCMEMKAPPVSVLDDITDRLIQQMEAGSSATVVVLPKAPGLSDSSTLINSVGPPPPPSLHVSAVAPAGAVAAAALAAAAGAAAAAIAASTIAAPVARASESDEFSGLTHMQEIVTLLEREAACQPNERVAKWNKWRERLDRQGEKFLEAWCISDAWRLTVKSILREPITDSDLRPLRELGRAFLVNAAEPDSAMDMLLSIAATEPDDNVVQVVAEMAEGMKRLTSVLTMETPLVVPASGDVAALAALVKKLQENVSPVAKVLANVQRSLKAMEQSSEIQEALKVPITEREQEMGRLDQEKVSVLARINVDRAAKTEHLDAQRAQIEQLKKKEVELMEQLNKLKQQREELEDNYEKSVVDAELEECNLVKKMEILETSVVDEEQELQCLQTASTCFSKYCSSVGGNLVKLLETRVKQSEVSLQKRVDSMLVVMSAFASVPSGATDVKALEKEFLDRVYTPVMADLLADTSQNAVVIQKLKAAKLDLS